MAGEALKTLLQQLKRVALPQGGSGLSDAELLGRWLAARDEAAFEVLVWRHGPMVLRLHQRLLCRAQDIEDAFQATFLALVRKAGSIRRPEAVASWLYRVAYRVALRVRAGAAQRAARETGGLDLLALTSKDCSAEESWRAVLDEEVNRLPAKYRATVVLCYLEGRTNEEAAGELGCPVGTIFSRLASARQLLQRRLARRGIGVGGALLGLGVNRQAASAALAPELAEAALRAARWSGPGHGSTATISARVVALAEGVLRSMKAARLKTVAALVLALGVAGAGIGGLLYRTTAGGDAGDSRAAAARTNAGQPSPDRRHYEPSCQGDGVLLVFGTEVKPGHKTPPSRLVTVTIGGERRLFQRLQVGDTVEDGQLLAQLDDRLARAAAATRQAKVAASAAELAAAVKARDEAKLRYDIRLRLVGAAAADADDDTRGAKLTWERFVSEAAVKEQQANIAKIEWQQAQTLVEMYQIRSRGRGLIRAIYRQPGEAVKALEPVCQIELRDNSGKPTGETPGKLPGAYDVPSQRAGIVLVIGTAAKPGERLSPDQLMIVTIGDKVQRYRRLREGDRVAAGELIARIDDRLARQEAAIKEAKLTSIEAELVASEATRDEAKRRYETLRNLQRKGAASQEETRAAEIRWARYVAEATAKRELVRVAELEWKEAQIAVELHEIRSAVRGVIKAIYKHPGEGVKYLDAVFRIEPFEDSRSADDKQGRLAAPRETTELFEPGVLDAASKCDVKCEVKTSGSKGVKISWIQTEGSLVKKGDLLVEFADSKNSKIYAPQAGVVVYNTRPKMATPGDSVAYGQELLTLYDLSHLVVKVQVPETSVKSLKPGLRATVQVDAVPDKTLRAHLKSIALAPIASPQDNKYQAIVYVDDSLEGLNLKPGMTAKVTVLIEAKGGP